jgi:secreted trypsin-like serine protease
MNPYYDTKTLENDFLLLFLDQPSAFAPVSLNRDPDVPEIDELLTIMGWGMDETGDFSHVPKQTVLKTRSNYDCALVWATANTFRQLFGLDEIMGAEPIYPEITRDTLCADDGDTSSGCPADSGGPLIVKGKDASTDLLVGVHSGGFDLCRLPENLSYLAAVFPSVNGRVSSAIKWIDEELSEASNTRS